MINMHYKNLIVLIIFFCVLCSINSSVISMSEVINKEDTDVLANYTEEYKNYLELSHEEKAKIKIIPRKYDVPFDIIYEDTEIIKEEPNIWNLFGLLTNNKLKATEIPTKYNLAEHINIRRENFENVDNLHNEYNAWAYASLKTLETNLLLHGYGEHNFSENHLEYIESDEFKETASNKELFWGGNFEFFEDYINQGYGPVLEEDVPNGKEYSIDEYEYLLNLKPKAYIAETINFPSIDKEYSEYTDEELSIFREKVKKHIMENGALYAEICSPNVSSRNNYNKNTYATYTSPEQGYSEDCVVLIIGWDDNYSRENFKADYQPNNNGAYIALFPTLDYLGNEMGNNGFFYISYEDINVEESLSGIVYASTNENDENIIKNVKFKDIKLYSFLKDYLGNKIVSCDDNNLTMKIRKGTINAIDSLEILDQGIKDLTGIEEFKQLEFLSLANNDIKDLSVLKNLENLTQLNLSDNKQIDISTLPLKEYGGLWLKNCNITNLGDLRATIEKSERKAMIVLDLSGNKGINLSTIPPTWDLDLSNCNITNLEHLIGFWNDALESNAIGVLNLSGNKNIDISTMKVIVEELYLEDCNITSLNGLKINEQGRLHLSNNENIDLATIPKVLELELKNCNITSLEGLNAPKWTLNLSGNKGIKVSTIPKVPYVLLNDCDITSAEGLSSEIEQLDLTGNKRIDVSTIPAIAYVILKDCNITDVEGLPEGIKWLDLSENKNISNLNKLKNIKLLELNDCNIKSIKDLLNLKELEMLSLENNSIEDYIDLLQLNNLRELDLSQNNISKIYTYNEIINYFKWDENTKNTFLDYKLSIKLHNNKITNYVEDIEYNKNKKGGDYSYKRTGWSMIWAGSKIYYVGGQNIERELNVKKDSKNTITELRGILESIYSNRYKDGIKIEIENCEIDWSTYDVVINNPKNSGKASLKIDGGVYDGFSYTINYKVEGSSETNETQESKIKYIEISGKKYITNYNTSNNTVSKIVEEIKQDDNQEIIVKSKNGQELGTNDIVGTGTSIKVSHKNNNVQNEDDEYIIIIKGDLDGNGKIDLYDIVKLIELVFDKNVNEVWNSEDKLSGEIDGDKSNENPNLYDIVRLIEYHFDKKIVVGNCI